MPQQYRTQYTPRRMNNTESQRAEAGIQNFNYQVPKTEYVFVEPEGGGRGSGFMSSFGRRMGPGGGHAPVPSPLPQFLGNRRIIVFAWIGSMATVAWDDWHNNGILPRPSRLWGASLLYGLLALASAIDPAVPLINALAIGYFIMVLWQYYSKGGQFA